MPTDAATPMAAGAPRRVHGHAVDGDDPAPIGDAGGGTIVEEETRAERLVSPRDGRARVLDGRLP